jgi:hypothetical protein
MHLSYFDLCKKKMKLQRNWKLQNICKFRDSFFIKAASSVAVYRLWLIDRPLGCWRELLRPLTKKIQISKSCGYVMTYDLWRLGILDIFYPFEVTSRFSSSLYLYWNDRNRKKQKKRHIYLLMVTLRLFYAPVNLTIFNFFHLLHWLQT